MFNPQCDERFWCPLRDGWQYVLERNIGDNEFLMEGGSVVMLTGELESGILGVYTVDADGTHLKGWFDEKSEAVRLYEKLNKCSTP